MVGLATRTLLVPYRLGTPHRVAILLIMTGIAMFAIVGVSIASPAIPDLSAAILFPAILMTWYSDRLANAVRGVGWQVPTKRLALTVSPAYNFDNDHGLPLIHRLSDPQYMRSGFSTVSILVNRRFDRGSGSQFASSNHRIDETIFRTKSRRTSKCVQEHRCLSRSAG